MPKEPPQTGKGPNEAGTKAPARTTTRKPAKAKSAGSTDEAMKAAIDAMDEADRILAEQLHAIVTSNLPDVQPRLWYGMPAYARNGKVLCFFQAASKFKTRYATLGFLHDANLDDGAMWPTAFAVKQIGPTEEAQIAAMVKKAAS